MPLPRVRFTVRRMMAAVAVAALVSLALAKVCRDYPDTERRAAILLGSLVAGAYGVRSARRPWVFLAPLVVLWVATPAVDHPSLSFWNVAGGGCFLGWLIGAPAGGFSRLLMGTLRSSRSPRDHRGTNEEPARAHTSS